MKYTIGQFKLLKPSPSPPMTHRKIVLTSSTYSESTNSTRIVYAEETDDGSRDTWKEHTLYHDNNATEQERNSEVEAFIAEKQTIEAL